MSRRCWPGWLGVLAVSLLWPAAGRAQASETPRRIVSLAPSLTEILFAVGAGPRVVGATAFSDYPPAARDVPRVGGLEDGSFDLEKVVALRPDLVLALDAGQQRTAAALARLGLRVEVVPSQTYEDVPRALLRVGELTGLGEPAAERAREFEERTRRVRERVDRVKESDRPRVFFQLWDRPLMTASRKTLAGQLIELAGGINVFADLPGRYPQVGPEAVLAANPQVVVVPDQHAEPTDLEALRRNPALRGTAALRDGRVLVLDGDLVSRAGPRVVEVLEVLARGLHPERAPRSAEP